MNNNALSHSGFFKRYPLLLVIPVAALIIALLLIFKPSPERNFNAKLTQVAIDAERIKQETLKPEVLSYGLVEPRVKSKVVAQVSGRITHISERFRDGGFFQKGEVLLNIEDVDYQIDVDIAEANLADAQRNLEEEQARVNQAEEDWQRLGQGGEPSALVLRSPQLKAAEAKLKSAKAQLRKARVNLARTFIKAPFDGRVLSTQVDLGQVVSANVTLGEVYATDAVEIRLPVKNSDLALLTLPESYLHSSDSAALTEVQIRSDLAGEELWKGQIVRTASSIDESSRQLYVVARIDDPWGQKSQGRFPLKIGQYVSAKITANEIEEAITVSNRAIYQGSYVYTYKDGAVYRRPISIRWQDENYAVLNSGLEAGELVAVSPLGQIASGTKVNLVSIDGEVQQATDKEKSNPSKQEH
ncbi:efflux RND transporter periplasmic adaptor subunit [Agaribacterium sp. ZY112]|uniref:efflux RND transporter periplasmic adaptor subunit n=1 Tax=Agaribacterium sp. ZY112 TaxID=3233574 RepID=UPI003523710F